jgi:hypothetical protein
MISQQNFAQFNKRLRCSRSRARMRALTTLLPVMPLAQ